MKLLIAIFALALAGCAVNRTVIHGGRVTLTNTAPTTSIHATLTAPVMPMRVPGL